MPVFIESAVVIIETPLFPLLFNSVPLLLWKKQARSFSSTQFCLKCSGANEMQPFNFTWNLKLEVVMYDSEAKVWQATDD